MNSLSRLWTVDFRARPVARKRLGRYPLDKAIDCRRPATAGRRESARKMSKPLEGVRVLEICNIMAGPFAGMLLGDMGADVIKVEALKGDMARAFPPLVDGESVSFTSLNRNKRSIAIDMRTRAASPSSRTWRGRPMCFSRIIARAPWRSSASAPKN
jgi:hypothetical protein